MGKIVTHPDDTAPLNLGMQSLRLLGHLTRLLCHPKGTHKERIGERPGLDVIRMEELVFRHTERFDSLGRLINRLENLMGALRI